MNHLLSNAGSLYFVVVLNHDWLEKLSEANKDESLIIRRRS
jgi:hypothetical protein